MAGCVEAYGMTYLHNLYHHLGTGGTKVETSVHPKVPLQLQTSLTCCCCRRAPCRRPGQGT